MTEDKIDEKKGFWCEECNKEFENLKQLTGHKLVHANAKKALEKKKAKRRERVPLGKRRFKLAFNAPGGTVGRVVNDNWHKNPNRIQDALNGGYEFVTRDEEGNMFAESEDENIGTRVSVSVGTNDDGSVITGYLMAIDKDLYDEDQTAKMEEVNRTEASIMRGKHREQSGDSRYVPAEGIKMERTTRPM